MTASPHIPVRDPLTGFATRIPVRQENLPPEYGGEGGDCLKVAICLAYGFDYYDTPSSRYIAEWEPWANERGLRVAMFDRQAPVGLDRWIAVVDGGIVAGEFQRHVIAMTGDEVLADSNVLRTGIGFTTVEPADIRGAYALLPIDQAGVECSYWPINRNEDDRNVSDYS